MFTLEQIITFVRNNLGEYLKDSPCLDWYFSRLYEKDQIIVIEENNEIKAIQAYFLCRDEDLPYLEVVNDWVLPINYFEGSVLYLALTISKDFKYLLEIRKRVRVLMHKYNITKIIAWDIGDKKVKIWTKVFNKWIFKSEKLDVLQKQEVSYA